MIDEQEKVGQGIGEGDAQPMPPHPKKVINFVSIDPTEMHKNDKWGNLWRKRNKGNLISPSHILRSPSHLVRSLTGEEH